jgi:tetratricopeptide (TPR) repeat protein
MIKNNIKITLLIGAISITSINFAQKSNEVNAAMEFESFQKKMMSQNYDDAKSALLEAKKYIDEAAVNPETAASPKTLYYKGQIYLMIPALASLKNDDAELKAMMTEENINAGIESLKKAYALDEKKYYREDIETLAEMGRMQAINGGVQKFKEEKYKEAEEMFASSAALYDIIGKVDTLAYYNAGLSAERAGDKEAALKNYIVCANAAYNVPSTYVLSSGLLRELKRPEEALALINKAREKYPNDKDLLLEVVNINLSMGDDAAAEKSLSDAIATDPNNKQLHFAIGTIYEKVGKPEKAEAAFKKALELDSMYEDAAYSLGAHFVNLGAAGKEKADKLPFGDPTYDQVLKDADKYYEQALPYLEKADKIKPNNPEVLKTLFQLYRRLGNTEKSAEYKAKYDALNTK